MKIPADLKALTSMYVRSLRIVLYFIAWFSKRKILLLRTNVL